MVENWKQVKTKAQRQKLVDRTVKTLDRLVSSAEVKDLIDDIDIAKREESGGEHQREIYLNKKGLIEARYCRGHIDSIAAHADDKEYYKCDYEDKPRKVPNREFRRIVVDYQLTPTKISKVQDSLKA